MVLTAQRMENRSVERMSVVLTGASSGIGAHIARNLVAGGARVPATARRLARLEALAEELSDSTGAISFVEADVTEANQVGTMFQNAVDRYDGIDALVNNAGLEVQSQIEELAEGDLRADASHECRRALSLSSPRPPPPEGQRWLRRQHRVDRRHWRGLRR